MRRGARLRHPSRPGFPTLSSRVLVPRAKQQQCAVILLRIPFLGNSATSPPEILDSDTNLNPPLPLPRVVGAAFSLPLFFLSFFLSLPSSLSEGDTRGTRPLEEDFIEDVRDTRFWNILTGGPRLRLVLERVGFTRGIFLWATREDARYKSGSPSWGNLFSFFFFLTSLHIFCNLLMSCETFHRLRFEVDDSVYHHEQYKYGINMFGQLIKINCLVTCSSFLEIIWWTNIYMLWTFSRRLLCGVSRFKIKLNESLYDLSLRIYIRLNYRLNFSLFFWAMQLCFFIYDKRSAAQILSQPLYILAVLSLRPRDEAHRQRINCENRSKLIHETEL